MLKNIPRLMAEDQLIDIQSISIGSGTLPRAQQTEQFNRLHSLIDGDEPIAPKRSTPSQVLAFAQMAGVKVVAGG